MALSLANEKGIFIKMLLVIGLPAFTLTSALPLILQVAAVVLKLMCFVVERDLQIFIF
jgi:hypothetical protein